MVSVSIITVVKDHATGLEMTYGSLLEQTLNAWEMIVVVGSSQDNTLFVARELQASDSRIRIIEQEGTGIYSAMNQGIESVDGEFTWFMNAGDRFATSSVLAHAVEEISKSGTGIVIGGYQISGGSSDKTFNYPSGNVTTLVFAFNRRGGCHQAMIFRTQILRDFGGFNTSYSLAGDFDLVLKVIKKVKAWRVSEVYASIEPGGRADQGIYLVHRQKHQIRRNLLGGPVVLIASLLWSGLATTKIVLSRFLKK